MHVEFEVLADLIVLRAFQPGFEFLQCGVAVHLIRRAGIHMRQRQIGRIVRCDRE
jgi:hypothetical protein